VIFYTLQGPIYELEIYADTIRLVKKSWYTLFIRKSNVSTIWKISDLSQFEITVPKFFMISGKIQWETFEGGKASFRFSTNPVMVKKIETYLQKRVIKNHQQKSKISADVPEQKKLSGPLPLAA
jgi:hypothetical protein